MDGLKKTNQGSDKRPNLRPILVVIPRDDEKNNSNCPDAYGRYSWIMFVGAIRCLRQELSTPIIDIYIYIYNRNYFFLTKFNFYYVQHRLLVVKFITYCEFQTQFSQRQMNLTEGRITDLQNENHSFIEWSSQL